MLKNAFIFNNICSYYIFFVSLLPITELIAKTLLLVISKQYFSFKELLF